MNLPNMSNHALEFSVSMLSLKYISDVFMYIDTTVDREIFTLKIIRMKIFHGVKLWGFLSIRENFLTVEDCNMDEHLESSSHLVY